MSKLKLWSGDFTLLLCINLLGFIACQALNNGTPIYVNHAGGGTGFSGALILEFSAFAAAARIFAGRLIDNGTRKRIMIFGAVIMFAGTAPALLLPGIEPQLVLRALQGIGFGCIHTAASTAAADVLPKERLGEGIGYFGLGQSLGMAVGPTFAVILTSMVFAESLFAGVAAVAMALFLLVMACTYERNYKRLPESSAYRQRREAAEGASAPAEDDKAPSAAKKSTLSGLFVSSALPGAIPMALVCLGYAIIVNFGTLYSTQIGIPNPGIFFVWAAVTMTAARLGGGSLLERIKLHKLIIIPLLCGIASLMLLASLSINSSMYVQWLAGALFGVSMGFVFPILNTVCVRNTVPERWGAASAMFGLMNDAGIGVGALIWGAVSDVVGFIPVMFGGCVMIALALVAALFLFPKDL